MTKLADKARQGRIRALACQNREIAQPRTRLSPIGWLVGVLEQTGQGVNALQSGEQQA